MQKKMTRADVEKFREYAVRDWKEFTPGVYREILDGADNSGSEVDYCDIVVLGLSPNNGFRYVFIMDYLSTPMEHTASLADSGVNPVPLRDKYSPGYLGDNFVVPIKHFQPNYI